MKKKISLVTAPNQSKVGDALDPEFTTKKKEPEEPVEFPTIGFFSLYRYSTALDKLTIFLGTLCSVGTGVCQPLNMLVFGNLTGDMISFASQMVGASPEDFAKLATQLEDGIRQFAIYNSLIGVAMLVLSYLSTFFFSYSGLRQSFKIRTLYLENALNQDISWYDKHQSGDFASRMTDDLGKLEEGLGEKVAMFLHFQISFVASLALALFKGWKLALICLISLPVTMISIGIVAVLTSKLAKKESDAYGDAGTIAEEVLGGIKTVLAFGGQYKESLRYSKNLIFAKDNNIKRSLFGGVGFGILWFCIYASYALAFWYGVGLVIEDKSKPEDDRVYTPGNMITVFFSVMTGSMNFGMSSPYIEIFGVSKGAAAKIYGIIDNKPIINASKGVGLKPDKVQGHISFSNIKFNYPNRPDVKILNGLNLNIKSGETVALVGSSGCGKSTCIQLMQRFYDPLEGSVTLDGVNLRDLDLSWLRSNIGVVGQEPVLFGTTISENIKYGCRGASDEDVKKAAKKANAHSFIQKLPLGYNTLVGERGAQLSGGQKQRIAIARALVREPAILLLDEATSALDTNSEAKVQAALDNASNECTTIIVAHRLSTIRKADRIVVINSGVAVEEGTHAELMDKKGEYFNLVTTQVSHNDHAPLERQVSLAKDENDDDYIDTDAQQDAESSGENDETAEEKDEDTENISIWNILSLNKPEKVQITVGCLTSLIMGGAMPIFAVLFGDIIAILAEDDNDYIRKESNIYCLMFLGTGVITGIATFLQIYMFGIAGEKLTMRIRGDMFETILKQEIGWFDRKENGVGALCAKLSGEAALVQGATGQRIGTVFQSLATIGLSVGLSMYYEWRLGFVALAFAPVIMATMFLQQRLMVSEGNGYRKSLENSTKLAVEAVGNIRTVASLNSEQTIQSLYVQELLPYNKIALRNTHFRAVVIGLARSVVYFAFAACMFYGGYLIRNDGLPFGDVLKVSQSMIMGTASVASALAFAPNFQKGINAAGKVFKLLQRQPKIIEIPNATNNEWKTGDIEYSQIHFSYPTRPSAKVLKGLDLSILNGKTVALVGPSGCGKSTIIQLLERYYDPKSGAVRVDGQDLQTMKLSSLRSNLGIVSQEPNLFDRTIVENIRYGDNSREVSMEEVIEAAKNANIHSFITSLPLGYDTSLGEKGAQLSGGQKQRIAIARALVRNPKVLLLDEATSALDTESEKVVQIALDKAKQGRTCITIAHRLTTIQDADVICVINEGRVFEMGTHSQLLSEKGLYYKLHSLQSGSKQ